MIDKKIASILICGGLFAALLVVACSDDGPKSPCPTRCGAAMVCDATQKRCVPAAGCQGGCAAGAVCVNGACECSAGLKDCNGDLFTARGDGCECPTTCNSGSCSDLPPHDAWIEIDAPAKIDAVKEAEAGVDAGGTVCSYNDQDACGKDSSRWCYQAACISCSAGFFNCNNTKGCECDKAGCNGSKCAGRCSGGECP